MADMFWAAITELGDPYYWIYFSMAIFFGYLFIRLVFKKRDERMKRLLSVYAPSMVVVFFIVLAIKMALPVPRPCIPCIEPWMSACNTHCLTDPSFPSGHTAAVFTAFTSLFLVFRDKRMLIVFIVPALVAYSRVALGVHTFLDIVGGALIACSITFLVWFLQKRSKHWIFREIC